MVFRVQNLWVWGVAVLGFLGLGFRNWDSGFRVQGQGFRHWGRGLRGSDLGCRTLSLVLKVQCSLMGVKL